MTERAPCFAPDTSTLAGRVIAALREIGAEAMWSYSSYSDPDDPSFTFQPAVVAGPIPDEAWQTLWRAFGAARPTGPWKVPCWACYDAGDGYHDYIAGLDRCENGWPTLDCGRHRD